MATTNDAPPTPRRGRWRLALYIASGLVVVTALATYVSTDRLRAFGGSPGATTLARMSASPLFIADHFENVEPTSLSSPEVLSAFWAGAFPLRRRSPRLEGAFRLDAE
jgi:hypothetical protein